MQPVQKKVAVYSVHDRKGADMEDFKRQRMVDLQIRSRGITNGEVLKVMEKVGRHVFVPGDIADNAYSDTPLPIGYGQTVSQPYIVAYMTEAINPRSTDKVLEIGTGCGYQTAVLAEIVGEVYTVEVLKPLAEEARKRLEYLGYSNIKVKWDDGYEGWEEYAPYDAVVVTASPAEIPEKLVQQLKPGGKMIIPIGSVLQELLLITKTEAGYKKEKLIPVRFVPMEHGKRGER